MGFLKFSDDAAMYDATPLDNLFIIENLPSAPEAFLKVYIYARMLCLHPEMGGMEELTKALKLDDDAILSAFLYWEQRGYVRRVADNPPEFVFLPVRAGSVSEMDRDYYAYRDFNNSIQALFPSGNMVHGAQFEMANDWLNVLHFSQESVLEILKYVIARSRSKNPNPASIFKIADKKAQNLSDAGITDAEAVRKELNRDEQAEKMAQEVLRHLGMRRLPSEPETALATKWLREWNYSVDDVLKACAETVKANNPSFAYLDRILESSRQQNDFYPAMKTLLDKLGSYQHPSQEQCEWYGKRLKEGFEPATLELAAVQQARLSNPSFDKLDTFLNQWRDRGLVLFSDASEYVERKLSLLNEMTAILQSAGIERRPSRELLAAFEEWKKTLPEDLIRYGAECSFTKKDPISYLLRLVETWSSAGITTVEDAKAAQAAPSASGTTAPQAKQNPALNYQQRSYQSGNDGDFGFMDEIRDLMNPS